MTFYKLDEDKNPVECTMDEWAKLYNGDELRLVGSDTINNHFVSTVFLGIDYSCMDIKPLLFETMIFGPLIEGEYQERYATWNDAIKGHKRAIDYAKELK